MMKLRREERGDTNRKKKREREREVRGGEAIRQGRKRKFEEWRRKRGVENDGRKRKE